MCVDWTSNWYHTEQDITAWKVTRERRSYFHPSQRAVQIEGYGPRNDDRGGQLEYNKGETIITSIPGIYLFLDVGSATSWAIMMLNWHAAPWLLPQVWAKGKPDPLYGELLQVRIPVDTMVRNGQTGFSSDDKINFKTINALTVEVLT